MVLNILTLLIVIIILILFRQSDKNNRSLDKVRRYVDKVTGDLDNYIDEKTGEMKNLAVEIDVHQKAGMEILKRINELEEGLNGRADDIEKVRQRIGEYDKVLEELMTMTGKVDENLQKLHEESEFVDKVGRRIKESRNRLEELEKSIPIINEEFAAVNRNSMEDLRRTLTERTEHQLQAVTEEVKTAEERVHDFSSRMDSLEEEREAKSAEALRAMDEKADSTLERLQTTEAEVLASVAGAEDAFRAKAEAGKRAYREALDELLEKARSYDDEIFLGLREELDEKAGAYARETAAFYEARKAEMETMRRQLTESLEESRTSMSSWQEQVRGDMEASRTDMENRYLEMVSQMEKWKDDGSRTMAQEEEARKSALSDFKEEWDRHRAVLEEGMQKARQEMELWSSNFQTSLEEKQAEQLVRFQDLEKQVGEYQEEVSYKLTRIESLEKEIDGLENNLNQTVDKAKETVRNDFKQAGEELRREMAEMDVNLKSDLGKTRQEMEMLMKGLEDLKTRAYDNVSENLKVFEDEFFSDLKERGDKMSEAMDQWQSDLDERLKTATEEYAAQRETLESGYSQELSAKLTQIQNRTYQQYQKFDVQIGEYEERLEGRINGVENRFKEGEQYLQEQMEGVKEQSRQTWEEQIHHVRTKMEEELEETRRDVSQKFKGLSETADVQEKELAGVMDSIKNDVTLWQTKTLQQIKDVDNELSEQYANMKFEAGQRMEEVRDILKTHKDEFDTEILDMQKRSRELEGEIDQKLRDFRQSSQDLNDKLAAVQQRLYEKVEESYNALSYNLKEIERRQKNFVNQTKIFERADTLKVTLHENIEELKGEISRVGGQVKEVKETEKKLLQMKKVTDDVSAKVSRFMNEKRRIDEMEGDFNRLMSISQSVDAKLDQITNSDDLLQSVQAKLMNLMELEKEIEQRYDRLDKKGTILDTTIDNIDRSFDSLRNLDEEIKDVQERSAPLSPRLDELARRIDFLSKNKKEVDKALEDLGSLDDSLRDVEERMEKMQKAREWLAGTETRLEEINRQAQEQVKLLGSLVKKGGAKGAGKGVPSHESRAIVKKLAHQGWSSQEIAKHTGFSVGEVELILELLPNS